MTNAFFKPMKKGEIYHRIDWEGIFQYVKNLPNNTSPTIEIDLLYKIATARALDHIYNYGITTQGV
jgi:hypothetical protein